MDDGALGTLAKQLKNERKDSFFGGGWGLNPGPCIYYALFIIIELSARGKEKAKLALNITLFKF